MTSAAPGANSVATPARKTCVRAMSTRTMRPMRMRSITKMRRSALIGTTMAFSRTAPEFIGRSPFGGRLTIVSSSARLVVVAAPHDDLGAGQQVHARGHRDARDLGGRVPPDSGAVRDCRGRTRALGDRGAGNHYRLGQGRDVADADVQVARRGRRVLGDLDKGHAVRARAGGAVVDVHVRVVGAG